MLSKYTFFKDTYMEDSNEELSQATLRIMLLSIFVSYFVIINDYASTLEMLLPIVFVLYGFVHFLWVKKVKKESNTRKLIAIVMDTFAVSLAVYFLEYSGILIFSIYIWIIVGNGMRFGSLYLFIAMFLSLLGFIGAIYTSAFWINYRDIGFSLAGIIILLPILFLVMTNRLKDINKQLKKQLEIQKHQEIILLQQSRHAAMGEMISNIAHQWRQPLNTVGLVFQNIENSHEMGVLNEQQLKRSVAKGVKLTEAMSRTIDDFRDFFKPNKHKELFSIDAVIKSSMEIVEMSFKQKNIEVILDFKDENDFYGYQNEFSQVILNILSNAKDVLLEREIQNAKVVIKTYKENAQNIIELSDNGGGIRDDIIDNIFDPYFTTKEHIDGTGIGLYMSKLIVEEHMLGRLTVQNTSTGALFKIVLPISSLDTGEDNVSI